MPVATHAHIRIDHRGVAWIDETNTKVIEVALDMIAHGWSPEEIHFQHAHLSLAQIHAALAYYYDHRAEMDAEIQRSTQEARAQRAQSGESPIRRRLRDMGKVLAQAGNPEDFAIEWNFCRYNCRPHDVEVITTKGTKHTKTLLLTTERQSRKSEIRRPQSDIKPEAETSSQPANNFGRSRTERTRAGTTTDHTGVHGSGEGMGRAVVTTKYTTLGSA